MQNNITSCYGTKEGFSLLPFCFWYAQWPSEDSQSERRNPFNAPYWALNLQSDAKVQTAKDLWLVHCGRWGGLRAEVLVCPHHAGSETWLSFWLMNVNGHYRLEKAPMSPSRRHRVTLGLGCPGAPMPRRHLNRKGSRRLSSESMGGPKLLQMSCAMESQSSAQPLKHSATQELGRDQNASHRALRNLGAGFWETKGGIWV